jgi:hypothetical protein
MNWKEFGNHQPQLYSGTPLANNFRHRGRLREMSVRIAGVTEYEAEVFSGKSGVLW